MNTKYFGTALVTTAIFVGSSASVSAEPVKLIAHDGTAEITGELVSFVDDVYTISTPIGSVRMRGSRVTCVGEYCPIQAGNTEGTLQSQ